MKRHRAAIQLAAFIVLVLAASGQLAAQRRAAFRPVVSPEIGEDGRVAFRLLAPQAQQVNLAGQWPDGNTPMEKGEGGLWEVTVGPIEPGVWEYHFEVDGLSMIDPGNAAIKPMRQPRTSILHVPGDPPQVHDLQDVPHGTVHLHTYQSKSLNRVRDLVVYTPPGYEQKADARYPTLYLQHGMGDNQATWTVHGKAHWIVDNLIAQQAATPMVVVMMDGHAAPPSMGLRGFSDNTAMFAKDLLEDVLPWVEENYRVRKDAASRAVVGLSMGGGQALTIGLNHADKFAWVGGFSSAVPGEDAIAEAIADPAALNDKLKLLWIGCGRDDFLIERNEDFVRMLEQKGIQHQWHLTEGNHSWPVWRRYLAQIVPLLFQAPADAG